MFREAIGVAVEQANSAVLAMSVLPPPDGPRGEMLREMLGIQEPLRLALLDGMPEPMDYSLAPPGWMFPEGCRDVVHHLPGSTVLLAGSPRIDREAMEVVYPGWGTVDLAPLAQAWREYMEKTNPPGYEVRERLEYEYEHPWKVRLFGQQVYQGAERADMRAFAWRCHERPHLVTLFVKLGKYLDKSLPEILGWTDEQYTAALAYIQAASLWESKRPVTPDFLA